MRFLSFCTLWGMVFITPSLEARVQPSAMSKVNNVKQPHSNSSLPKAAVVKQLNPSLTPPLVIKPLPEIAMGEEKAPIHITMYFSPTCHHCAEYERKILPQIHEEFITTGKVRFIMRLLPFHRLDYTVAKLVWSRGYENVIKLTQLFLSHQTDWLDPVLEEEPKKREKFLQNAFKETVESLNIPIDVLQDKLRIQDNMEDAFVLLFALRKGFTLKEIENALQENPDLENGLTAAHVQATESFGKSLDYVPAFLVNGKAAKDWPKSESLRKLLQNK